MKNLFIFLFLFIAFVSHAQTVSITSSVPSNTFCPGTSVTFTASTTGITNPTYQWYKNGVPISGATNSTYSTNALSQGDQIYVSVPATVSGSLITSGLKFNFDAGNSSSYSGSGTTLTDLSGSGTHATFQNAPTFVSSPIKTFQWNTRGSNGSNSTKASLSNVLGNDMTVGAWIKTSNIGNDLAHYRLLYILTGEQGGGANDWGFGIDRLGKLAFGAGPNDVTISSSTTVNTNEWTYVVATRAKSTGQIKLYINGAFNNSGTGNSGNTLNAQSNILIADGNDGPAHTFEGNIAIIEGYNAVLSADDVLANFNANKGRFGISSNLNSNTITASLSNLSAPVTTTGDACVNKTILSTNSGLTAYAWYKDDVSIAGATTNTFSPVAAGAYKVQVSNGTCSVFSAVTTISTCGVTADGRMRAITSPTTLVSHEGGINFGTGVNELGSTVNATGISTTLGTIGATTAVVSGVISSTNARTTSIGVIYSTDSNFGTYSTSSTQSNVAAGTHAITLSGLSSTTTYHAKSFIVNKAGTSYGPAVSFTTTAPPVALGASYGGGIVVYLYTSGDAGYVAGETHGLIAATQNQVTGGTFANVNSNLNNPLYHSTAGQAYTDWRIPSLVEIRKIYDQKSRFGAFDFNSYYIVNVPAVFTNSSSSFYAFDMTNAGSGTGFGYPCNLRAVRSF